MAGHILTCDDELHIVKLVELTLRKVGHRVTGCTHGETAWAHLQMELPDLLICDSQMPGLSGLELCRRIRLDERTRDLPVLLLAPHGFPMAQQRLERALKLAGIIRKPFSPRDLLSRITALLPERSVATADHSANGDR